MLIVSFMRQLFIISLNFRESPGSNSISTSRFDENRKPFRETSAHNQAFSSSQSFVNCLIGGMATQAFIDSEKCVNVMSRRLFRKMRVGLYTFYTFDMISLKIGGIEYLLIGGSFRRALKKARIIRT